MRDRTLRLLPCLLVLFAGCTCDEEGAPSAATQPPAKPVLLLYDVADLGNADGDDAYRDAEDPRPGFEEILDGLRERIPEEVWESNAQCSIEVAHGVLVVRLPRESHAIVEAYIAELRAAQGLPSREGRGPTEHRRKLLEEMGIDLSEDEGPAR